jgi:hypothetical protein
MFFHDPESFNFWGLIRSSADRDFTPIMTMSFPWASPTLGIRFERFEHGLEVFYPNGDRFKDPEQKLFGFSNPLLDRSLTIGPLPT